MNKILLNFIFITVTNLGLYGCAIDKPPPPWYLYWKMPGKSETDVKKSLLECGYLNAYNGGLKNFNDEVLSYRCMRNQGYIYNGDREICSGFPENKKPPACLPDAIIPKPSVERRLNDTYCKIEKYRKNNPECQP